MLEHKSETLSRVMRLFEMKHAGDLGFPDQVAVDCTLQRSDYWSFISILHSEKFEVVRVVVHVFCEYSQFSHNHFQSRLASYRTQAAIFDLDELRD